MTGGSYQQRAAVRALQHSAMALGCLALGDFRAAGIHTKASALWSSLAVYAASIVRLGRVPQWLLDAMWVEPAPVFPAYDSDEPEDLSGN